MKKYYVLSVIMVSVELCGSVYPPKPAMNKAKPTIDHVNPSINYLKNKNVSNKVSSIKDNSKVEGVTVELDKNGQKIGRSETSGGLDLSSGAVAKLRSIGNKISRNVQDGLQFVSQGKYSKLLGII